MTHHEDTAKDHLAHAKDDIKEAALLITDSVKTSAGDKIEHAKDKTKDAVESASSALINAVDKIHDTDAIPAK
jgi:hypothetical protein